MGLTKNMCKTAKGVRVEQISCSMLEYANDEREINLLVTTAVSLMFAVKNLMSRKNKSSIIDIEY